MGRLSMGGYPLIFPMISDNPSILVRVVGRSLCILHVRNEVIKRLKTHPKGLVGVMNYSQLDENGNFVQYLFISFNSENDQKEYVNQIESAIRETCRDGEVEYSIIPYIKYGVKYVPKEWPTIYYESSSMETTTIPVDVFLNMFKTTIRLLGPGARALFLEVGKDNGQRFAILLRESIDSLIASKDISKVIDALFRTMLHFGHVFQQEVTQENNEVIVKVKPRIVDGEIGKAMLELIVPLTRYYYGVLYGLFEKVGLEPKIEVNPETGKIESLKLKVKEFTKEYEYTIKIVPEENIANTSH